MKKMMLFGLLGFVLLPIMFCAAPMVAGVHVPATPTPDVLQFLGGKQVALARKDFKTTGLAWSPDSTRLAITYSKGSERWTTLTSLYQLNVYSGEMILLTEMDHAMRLISWLQDDHIAFSIPSYVNGDLESGTWLMLSDGSLPKDYAIDRDVVLWSLDGEQVAIYGFVQESNNTKRSITIKDMMSGLEKEIFEVKGDNVSLEILDWSLDADSILLLLDTEYPSNNDIYSLSLETSEVTRLTDGKQHGSASWSPDGELIAYIEADYQIFLYVMKSDGSCPISYVATTSQNIGSVEWSPDGHWIAFIWNEGVYLLDTVEVLGTDYSRYKANCP